MQEYSDAHHDELVARRATLDKVSKANMERCAEFMARMIMKYGKKVLEEIEAEEAAAIRPSVRQLRAYPHTILNSHHMR